MFPYFIYILLIMCLFNRYRKRMSKLRCIAPLQLRRSYRGTRSAAVTRSEEVVTNETVPTNVNVTSNANLVRNEDVARNEEQAEEERCRVGSGG